MGRIDYCLLFGLPSVHLLKLQRLQNAAARLISNVPRYSHITPVLSSLHWLPVKFRTDFKILPLTFKAIYGHAPGYLTDLVAIDCAVNRADWRILKTPWIVDQLYFLAQIPDCASRMFGFWVLNEIWIIELSSTLVGMLLSSSKLLLFFSFERSYC